MLVLVTQGDGSARRLPWFSYALAVVLAAFFVLHHFGGGEGVADTDSIVAGALLYFEEHPVVELDSRFESIAGADYAEEMREAYIEDRRARGLPLLSTRLRMLMQEEFDALVEQAYQKIDELPAWRLGVRSGDRPVVTSLAHSVVHATGAALLLSILVLLLVGSALEDGWGHSIFGAFCLAAIALGGAASRVFDYYEQTGVPWIGASGLAAALLGAHLVRSLRGSPRLLGSVPLPGWLLLPVWLCAEYLLVREISSAEDFVPVLVTVHAVCLGVGVAFGVCMMVFRVERRLLERSIRTPALISNPGLERAMQARADERPEDAFELLRREFRRSAGERDVALAFWDVARELGRSRDAVAAALIVLRGDMRSGQSDSAVRLWLDLNDTVADLQVDPTLCVRMGEALLDEGFPDEAIAALGRAVEADDDLSPVMARRVVRIARDLDPDLTRSAAAIALRDPQLEPSERQQLNELTRMLDSDSADVASRQSSATVDSQSPASAFAPPQDVSPAPSPFSTEDASSSSGFSGDGFSGDGFSGDEIPVAAEPVGAEALDLAPDGAGAAPVVEDLAEIDPHALSLDAIQADLDRGIEDEREESWNQPGLLTDLDDDLDADLDARLDSGLDSGLGESTGEFNLDPDELEIDPEDIEQAAVDAGVAEGPAVAAVESEPTQPIIEPARVEDFDLEPPADFLEDDDNALTRVSGAASRAAGKRALRLRLGEAPKKARAPKPGAPLRSLRIRTALPLRIEEDRLLIEVDDGGKTRLPFARIEGLAVAAVKGIAAKPVVVVDFVVNWGAAQGPLKLIRLRSDRYDPRALVQGIRPEGASPPADLPALEALRIFLDAVLDRSNATPLPNDGAARGQAMATYDSLADYHREVLMAEERADS